MLAQALEAELLVRARVVVEEAGAPGFAGRDDKGDDDEEGTEGVDGGPYADADLPGRVGRDRVDDVCRELQVEEVRVSDERNSSSAAGACSYARNN